MSKTDDITRFFDEYPGIHSMKELSNIGAHRNLVRALVEEGIVEEVCRGFYQIAGYEPEERFDLVEVSALIPKGIFCLVSALDYHEIGTQIPREYHLAVPTGQNPSRRKEYPIKTYSYSMDSYKIGIENHGEIKVFSIAKTIADCFKFRNKIGLDVAMEALKETLRNKRATRAEIIKMAEACKVKKVIMPYMEALSL